MSFAVRNTIALVIILLILGGAGWGWLKLTYGDILEKLEVTVVKREARLDELEIILADYDYMKESLDQTLRRQKYYPKVLLPEETVHETYKYLESIAGRRASFDYEYKLSGISEEGDILFANYQLKGKGSYRNINKFVHYLENSKPLYKIESLNLSRPAGSQSASGDIDVTLKFKGIFSVGENPENLEDEEIYVLKDAVYSTRYNPFRPFVLNILPPNTENLLVVERARVIAILKGLAYIQHQQGNMLTMRVGDRVYLGILEKIDLKKGEVVFAMNRGGIFDRVILKLES